MIKNLKRSQNNKKYIAYLNNLAEFELNMHVCPTHFNRKTLKMTAIKALNNDVSLNYIPTYRESSIYVEIGASQNRA